MRIRKTDVDPGVPSFTIVAKDVLAVPTLEQYKRICNAFGLVDQTREVQRAIDEVVAWQEQHREDTHLPSHQHRNLEPPPGYFDLLQAFVNWFEENDGVADDFGELFIVKQAKHYLESWNERTEHP